MEEVQYEENAEETNSMEDVHGIEEFQEPPQ